MSRWLMKYLLKDHKMNLKGCSVSPIPSAGRLKLFFEQSIHVCVENSHPSGMSFCSSRTGQQRAVNSQTDWQADSWGGGRFFLDVSEQKLTWGWEELSTHAALCWERDADSSVASGFTSCCHKDSRIKSSRLRGVSLLFWVLCELLLHVCTFLSVSLFHFWRKETGGKIRRNYKSKNVVKITP